MKYDVIFNWVNAKGDIVYDGFFIYASDKLKALKLAKKKIKNFKQKYRKKAYNLEVA